MSLSRREFMWLGLSGVGLLALGCAGPTVADGERPGPLWGGSIAPRPRDGFSLGPPVKPSTQTVGPGIPQPGAINGPIAAIPRGRWTSTPPMAGRILPMGSIERITVHHEGSTEVTFSDFGNTAVRMESIRASHLERLHAGDIGYHYVIDRAGNVWQGRDLAYQGAHVRDHNANNVGVMVLGNFDIQRPTEAQLTTLRATVSTLRQAYRVPLRSVFTHQELNPTECPGVSLQGRMVTFRQSGLV